MLLRILAGLAVLLLLQLVRPELISRPATTAELQAPAAVKQIFKRSCYPCHSNQAQLSWFDQIVPVYWLVASDVNKARSHLNFSELGAESTANQRAALFQAVNFIEKGLMPLPSYTRVHPNAVVTRDQLTLLQKYLLPTAQALPSESVVQAADREYRTWIAEGDKPVGVQDSPNGIKFIPTYREWKMIDSTSRFDANTLRIILGNDVAIKAIADKSTNPWPDGTKFAKVGWHQQMDAHGVVHAGAFLKVGFMIKDKIKYASTAGWGWAEWEGTRLKPYGNDPGFARECLTCHSPLRKNDFVFTMPIQYGGSTQ